MKDARAEPKDIQPVPEPAPVAVPARESPDPQKQVPVTQIAVVVENVRSLLEYQLKQQAQQQQHERMLREDELTSQDGRFFTNQILLAFVVLVLAGIAGCVVYFQQWDLLTPLLTIFTLLVGKLLSDSTHRDSR